MKKYMKPEEKYFIININEPYAEEVYEVLKKGQQEKGKWPEGDISFEEWEKQTFRTDGCKGCAHLQTSIQRFPCNICARPECNWRIDYYKPEEETKK